MITALFRYTLLRLALLVAALALGALAGLDGLLLLAVAILVSGLVSLLVLRGSRDELSRALVARGERFRARTAREDAADDAARAAARADDTAVANEPQVATAPEVEAPPTSEGGQGGTSGRPEAGGSSTVSP